MPRTFYFKVKVVKKSNLMHMKVIKTKNFEVTMGVKPKIKINIFS